MSFQFREDPSSKGALVFLSHLIFLNSGSWREVCPNSQLLLPVQFQFHLLSAFYLDCINKDFSRERHWISLTQKHSNQWCSRATQIRFQIGSKEKQSTVMRSFQVGWYCVSEFQTIGKGMVLLPKTNWFRKMESSYSSMLSDTILLEMF